MKRFVFEGDCEECAWAVNIDVTVFSDAEAEAYEELGVMMVNCHGKSYHEELEAPDEPVPAFRTRFQAPV